MLLTQNCTFSKSILAIFALADKKENNWILPNGRHILENENKLLQKTEVTNVNPELLQSRYEKDLFNSFKRLKQKKLDLNELMKSLVTLSQPINIFFEKVQINDKNILLKTNRLYLLFNIKNYVVREIDFSKIIKGKEL